MELRADLVGGRLVERVKDVPSELPGVAGCLSLDRLLRNEFVMRGGPTAPDEVLVEIVDEVYLPLARQRGTAAT